MSKENDLPPAAAVVLGSDETKPVVETPAPVKEVVTPPPAPAPGPSPEPAKHAPAPEKKKSGRWTYFDEE